MFNSFLNATKPYCSVKVPFTEFFESYCQRWSREHMARGQSQGHKKKLRPRTKDTGASAPKKEGLQNFFSGEKGLQKFFFGRSPLEHRYYKKSIYAQVLFCRIYDLRKTKKGLLKFSAWLLAFSNKILTVQKIVLCSSRGQCNFGGLEASRSRTAKCVLKDVLEA